MADKHPTPGEQGETDKFNRARGEVITSIEQFGHRPEGFFFIRTKEHPQGGWTEGPPSATIQAAGAAAWAALKAGAPPCATLFYTSWRSDGWFLGIERIYLP